MSQQYSHSSNMNFGNIYEGQRLLKEFTLEDMMEGLRGKRHDTVVEMEPS